MTEIIADAFPDPAALAAFWRRAWGGDIADNYAAVLQRSLGHVVARDGERLVGFANIAWDGGVHAFLLDVATDPDYRCQGLATRVVERATALAWERGATWLHVDFEPHLEGFYRGCGFRHSAAGLIRLR